MKIGKWMAIVLCVITLFSAGCGCKSNNDATSSAKTTVQDEEKAKAKAAEEAKAKFEKAKPAIQDWGQQMCLLYANTGEQLAYWWPQAQGNSIENYKASHTLNINTAQYQKNLLTGSGVIPANMPDEIKAKMEYARDELDKSMSITIDLTAKYGDIIMQGSPMRPGQKQLIDTMERDIKEHRGNALAKLKEIYSDIGADMPDVSYDASSPTKFNEDGVYHGDDGRVYIKY